MIEGLQATKTDEFSEKFQTVLEINISMMTMWSSGSQEPRTIVGDVQVRRGMGDGDPSTRAEARKAYWAFGDAFRFLPDSLFIIRFPTNML